MKIITINGWGQEAKSLDFLGNLIAKKINTACEVLNIDYSKYRDYTELTDDLADQQECDILIGWSLGGQNSARLVADKKIKPKLLVLLAPTFQLIKGDGIDDATDLGDFEQVKSSFHDNFLETANGFKHFIAEGDSNGEVVEKITMATSNYENWLQWLNILGEFSCKGLDYSDFPKTLIIHGEEDAVIPHQQTDLFTKYIPNTDVIKLQNTSHAPHLHDTGYIINAIIQNL